MLHALVYTTACTPAECFVTNQNFRCKEVGENTWQIFDQPATHPCCPDYVTSYHSKVRTVPEECLKEIQKLASSGVFSSDHIQQHLYRSNGWNIATDLIYHIGYRVRCKLFGGNGNNDTLHLKSQQEARQKRGDIYDLHYSQSGSLKNIVWVSSYAHLVLQYFDYFVCDGTHGISKYGWKFIPLCIVTSGDWIIPIGAVFGLEEDTESLKLLHETIRRHLEAKNVDYSAFQQSQPEAFQSPAPPCSSDKLRSWCAIFLRNFLYPPEMEECIVMALIQSWKRDENAQMASKCQNCQLSGHNSKWCILPKRTSQSPELNDDEIQKVFQYFDFLANCPITFGEKDISAAVAKAASTSQKPPTLHVDGGTAFSALCKEISREKTACAIHLESKVCLSIDCDFHLLIILSGSFLQSRHQEHGVQVCGVEVIEKLQGYSGVHQRALHEDGCDASLRGCACITYAVVYTSA